MEKENQTSVRQLIGSIVTVEEDNLSKFLILVDAPPKCDGIIEVTAQFLKLVPFLEKISHLEAISEFICDKDLEVCKMVAISIQGKRAEIERLVPTAASQNEKVPYKGLHTHFPLYSCLGKSFLDHENSQKYLILQAYLVYSTSILRRRKDQSSYLHKSKEYKSIIYESSLLVRKLLAKHKHDSRANLPEYLPILSGEYYGMIERSGELLEPIRKLLEYVFSGKRAPTYVKSGEKKEFRTVSHTINDALDPELSKYAEKVDLYQPIASAVRKKMNPQESTRGFEFLQISNRNNPMEGLPPEQHKFRKQYYLSSIAMHNQRLPHRWEMLNLYEVSLFLEVVEQLSNGICPYYKQSRYIGQLELGAVAATIFLRSLPVENIGTINLNDGAYGEIAPPGYRYYHDKIGCWVARPPKLPIDTTLGKQFFAGAELRREFYYLSSGTMLETIVDKYIANNVKKSSGKKLFHKDYTEYKERLEQILKGLNGKFKTRLTLKRVEYYLFNVLTRENGGDLTTAMLLTGRDDFLGMPPLHYTAYPVSKLQVMYRDCCVRLWGAHSKESTSRSSDSKIDSDHSRPVNKWFGTAGSAYRPRRKVVRKMVKSLQNRICKTAEMPIGLHKYLLLHNNIMRYTAIMFSFATGFRAVTSPVLPPAQIDNATGFAVISDKDGIDYYNARIVWLPPVCRTQYKLYMEHLQSLLPKLELLDIQAFNDLRHLLNHPRPGNRFPLFFFLTNEGTSTRVRPIDIWKEIRRNLQYDLPANAGRHYLRSHLLENGCPPEVIAAFMGHWERGEEPWGKFSAFSPITYAETLASFLVPMLDSDGWLPMPGLRE